VMKDPLVLLSSLAAEHSENSHGWNIKYIPQHFILFYSQNTLPELSRVDVCTSLFHMHL
jgi:hypothetical protein